MRKIIFFILISLITAPCLLYAQKKHRVVLLPLEAKGITYAEECTYQATIQEALSGHYEIFSGSKVIEKLFVKILKNNLFLYHLHSQSQNKFKVS